VGSPIKEGGYKTINPKVFLKITKYKNDSPPPWEGDACGVPLILKLGIRIRAQ